MDSRTASTTGGDARTDVAAIASLILAEMRQAAAAANDGVVFEDEQIAYIEQALADAAQEALNRQRDARDLLYAAVSHTLDQIQVNPDVHYYCGWGTQIFYLLVKAEAACLGKPLDEVEKERRKDRQPAHRRREAEVLRLRDQRDELRTQLDSVGGWPR